jgi:hypothetical protein
VLRSYQIVDGRERETRIFSVPTIQNVGSRPDTELPASHSKFGTDMSFTLVDGDVHHRVWTIELRISRGVQNELVR